MMGSPLGSDLDLRFTPCVTSGQCGTRGLPSGSRSVTLRHTGGARRQMRSPEHISLGIDQFLGRLSLSVGGVMNGPTKNVPVGPEQDPT